MSAISLAVIGKNNEPLYIKEFVDLENRCVAEQHLVSDEELFGLPRVDASSRKPQQQQQQHAAVHNYCSLRQQFILHAALDRFEHLSGPHPGFAWRAPGVSGTDAMWVGLLCPVEDMRVYGTLSAILPRGRSFLVTV